MFARNLTILAAALGLAAAVAGCGGAGGKGGAQDSVSRGREVFRTTCAACHGADAKGLPGMGKNLVNPSDWMKQQDDAALIAFIKRGRPVTDPVNTTKVEMPPKGGNPSLTDADIADVVAYIRSLQAAAK